MNFYWVMITEDKVLIYSFYRVNNYIRRSYCIVDGGNNPFLGVVGL